MRRLEGLLKQDGIAWLQLTARSKHLGLSNRWLQRQLRQRYSLPLLSTLLNAVETTRLRTLQLEDRSAHWRQTLEIQGQRFGRQRWTISKRFGEPLTRYWEFMLASQETAARLGQLYRYDLLLGAERTHWPPRDSTAREFDIGIPAGLGLTITGLTPGN